LTTQEAIKLFPNSENLTLFQI